MESNSTQNDDKETVIAKPVRKKLTTKKQLNFFEERDLHHSQEIKRNQQGIKYADKRLKELEKKIVKIKREKLKLEGKLKDCKKYFVGGAIIQTSFLDLFKNINLIIKDNQRDLKNLPTR